VVPNEILLSMKLFGQQASAVDLELGLFKVQSLRVDLFRFRRPVTVFFVLAAVALFIHQQQWQPLFQPKIEISVPTQHPIEVLVEAADKDFTRMTKRQSSTIGDARDEYMRRYGMLPPGGFQTWFHLARHHEFELVDEFDSMMRQLQPFRSIESSVLRQMVSNACKNKELALSRLSIDKGVATATSVSPRFNWASGDLLKLLPEQWRELLPNMIVAVNYFDEPVVSIPRDLLDNARAASSISLQHLDGINGDAVKAPRFITLNKQDVFEAATLSCPANASARQPYCTTQDVNDSLLFVSDLKESRDVCQHCEFQEQHGFFMSPSSLYLTRSLVPIFSQGTPSTFNDITYPSSFYLSQYGDYDILEDPSWERKHDKLYWTGSDTGGYATQSNWRSLHRQRLVLATQNSTSEHGVKLLHQGEDGAWEPFSANMSEVLNLFSIRMAGVGQCEWNVCTMEREAFGGDALVESKDSRQEAYKYKFLLDVDGNGFSGRYHRYLQSNSLVFKQTIFEEAYDDRLIPWVHYIPVSTSFDELPELVRFLATEDSGKKIAERIAKSSSEWAARSLRPVDMQLIFLRLLMEYGRIYNGDANV
jgi:hypothetical protein